MPILLLIRPLQLAITAGAVVVQQSKHLFPGKEGLKEAIERMSADIIVFLDADIRNLTTDWVNVELVVAEKSMITVICQGDFILRHAGYGSNKTYCKTNVKYLLSRIIHFEQPLSGEVCARAQV